MNVYHFKHHRCDLDGNSLKILAVVITFNPDESVFNNIHLIKDQFKDLLIIDDSGIEIEWKWSDFKVKKNVKNFGHAYSLNIALDIASKHSYEYIITFDQDTKILPWFRKYFEETLTINHAEIIGSTRVKSVDFIKQDPNIPISAAIKNVKSVITSGTAYQVSTIINLGGFKENFFIDQIDHEICFRARENGISIKQLTVPLMVHVIGTRPRSNYGLINKLKDIFGTNEHASIRWYYISRNYCYLVKLYLFKETFWLIHSFIHLVRWYIGVCLFEENKFKKTLAILKGVLHAIQGKTGKYVE